MLRSIIVAFRSSIAPSSALGASLGSQLLADLRLVSPPSSRIEKSTTISPLAVMNGRIVSSELLRLPCSLSPLLARSIDQDDGHGNTLLECGKRGTNYQPSRAKRVNKHGLEKRIQTPEGRHMLVRRLLKQKRARITVDAFI